MFIGAFAAYETYNFIKYTAMHEITHLLGADDHRYTNEACIHVSSYIGVDANTGMSATNDKKNLPICSICKDTNFDWKWKKLYDHNS